jgi:hypothetical protein
VASARLGNAPCCLAAGSDPPPRFFLTKGKVQCLTYRGELAQTAVALQSIGAATAREDAMLQPRPLIFLLDRAEGPDLQGRLDPLDFSTGGEWKGRGDQTERPDVHIGGSLLIFIYWPVTDTR